MAMEDIDVIQLQPGEALVDAPGHPLRAEIEAIHVAAALGGYDDIFPRHVQFMEAVPEHSLRDRAPIIPNRKEEIGRG